MAYVDSATRRLNIMLDVVHNGLVASSPTVDVPPETFKIQLREHQQAALKAMELKELSLMQGIDISGEKLYGDHAILGDSVGVGKSYMVLGHIARIMRGAVTPLISRTEMQKNASTHLFSIKTTTYSDVSEAGCLIVVPHTLFRQWVGYIKQTNLKSVLLDKLKVFDAPDAQEALITSILAADVVLVSNTLYKRLSAWQRDLKIRWKRAFFDEMDTMHMVQGYPKPVARFTWFVTASWMNVLFANETIILPNWVIETMILDPTSRYSCLAPHFTGSTSVVASSYRYMRFNMTSYNYYREYIENSHPLRGNVVVRCDDKYIQESISLPPLYRHQILCKSTIAHQIVGDAVPIEVQNLLHAGDVTGAMEALGIKAEDTTNLIDAVTKNLQKELTRLRQTLKFKSELEYSTVASKETALKSLEEKIKRVTDQIDMIRARIEGFKSEACPICYDEPSEPTVTPCSHIFCGQCILACLTKSQACPMCREPIHPSKLKRLGTGNQIVAAKPVSDEPQLEKKSDALLRIIRESPEGRFLVFSRYDNPFSSIERAVTDEGITVKHLKGNKDVIASTLNAFDSGKVRCLLLNAGYAGAGLNITAATHVILLHAMTSEEEKQILGRAYRMGRKGPLQFIKLLHADEITAPVGQ